MHRFWLATGAINMLVALVVAAATGHVTGSEFVPVLRQTLDTAREMHFVHALALIAVGLVDAQFGHSRLINIAGYAFFSGIVCFSGGIYLAFIVGVEMFRMLIPLGGVALMLGWILFAAGACFLPSR